MQHRLGKSKGYVSVLGYLGQALAGLAPEDLAPYRAAGLTPRVVWPLATRARTEERTALKQAFGDAVTEAARDAARRRARDRATVQLRAALRVPLADDDAVRACLEFAQRIAAEAPGMRDAMYAPAVPVPDDAPLLDRLIGQTGRDPRWRP